MACLPRGVIPAGWSTTPNRLGTAPRESDRARFVELFCDDDFRTFSSGVLTPDAAHDRFDEMLTRGAELPFARQPVIERSTGIIVGYTGVDWFDFDGRRRLEFGYRLVPEVRGRGYATEASRAVLAIAAETYRGEILAIIDPTNHASRNVDLRCPDHVLRWAAGRRLLLSACELGCPRATGVRNQPSILRATPESNGPGQTGLTPNAPEQ